MEKTVYRLDRELKGKDLSSNTIASFLAAQGTRSVPELSIESDMSSELLVFLNRERAMRFWVDNGWLVKEGPVYRLTDTGIDEVLSREAGVACGVTGKKKPSNVSPMKVAAALRLIETGETSGDETTISKTF